MNTTIERQVVEAEQFDHSVRRYNDTVTWLAEVLPGSMRTPFEYQFDGRELYASDGGALKPIFDDAVEQAKNLPVYEQRRRVIERQEYDEMIAMMRGDRLNTMVVVSDFPPELMDAARDVGGYNVTRKQTMLRVLARSPDGSLSMYSQSLDGSDRRSLEAIYETLGFRAAPGELLGQRMHAELSTSEQELLVDKLMGVYDRSLRSQYGGEWYAGRSDIPPLDTFSFACQQKDLIGAYLATTHNFSGSQADYDLAAAITARYALKCKEPQTFFVAEASTWLHGPGVVAHIFALEEMRGAGNVARDSGITFSGCGATISSRESTLSSLNANAQDQLRENGFGNKSEKLPDDKYGTRYFKCPKGHQNTRWKKDKLIERCQICKCSVRC